MYLKNISYFFYILHFSKVLSANKEIYSYVGCYDRKNMLFENSFYSGNVQQCIDICDRILFRYAVLYPIDKCSCSNELMNAAYKLDFNFCNTPCSKRKQEYCGGIDAQSFYSTNAKKLEIISRTNTTIAIKWDKSRKGDKITNFMVKASVLESFASYPILQKEWDVSVNEDRFELIDLHPGTVYNISVEAMCDTINCRTYSVRGETIIGTPDPPNEPRIVNRTDTTLTVEIVPGINNYGPISYYRIVVLIIDDVIQQQFDENLLSNYNQSQQDGIPYYITGEINFVNHTHDFHVGDGFEYRNYYNAPLPPKAHIHILLGVVSEWRNFTTTGYAKATHEQHNPLGIIIFDQKGVEEEPSLLTLTIACSILGILLAFSIVAYIFLRYKTANQRQRLCDSHELTMQGPVIEIENNSFTTEEVDTGTFKTHLKLLIDKLDVQQKFPRNAIRLNIDNVIASGRYGEVITGKLNKNTEIIDCQVHVVSDDMDNPDKMSFLKDLQQISHCMPQEKLVHFLGVSASPDWFYLIFQMYPTTLKKKLLESRVPHTTNENYFSFISEERVIQWIYDISVAMEYLEINKIYHRQLCSHNIYLTNLDEIKVSLFGPTPYVELNKPLDISRWMAPEVLRFKFHSSKSDIWSFACVAWECCTLGATPFGNTASKDILQLIKNGSRPEQPVFVFSDLYQLFLNCWQIESTERPNFDEVSLHIRQILTSPKHFISFNRIPNMKIPYYLPLLEIKN